MRQAAWLAGVLIVCTLGAIAGRSLSQDRASPDPEPPELAPPEPPVLAVGVTCDELKVWQREEALRLRGANTVQGKQASALAVIAYTLAHATCRP